MERMQQVLVKMVMSPSIFQLNQPEQQDLQASLASVIDAEEFKATQARPVSTLLFFEDRKVRHASKTIKCDTKWKPQKAVTEAHWKHQF